MKNKYVCPFCECEYVADKGEEEKFETFECPFCGAEIQFSCNEKGEENE